MMAEQTVTRFKWFWPWQDDRQEQWLCEQSQQGRHLAVLRWPSRYAFMAGEPRSYVYRLDWREASRRELPDYLLLFADAGWEHVGSLAGWQYFRRPTTEEPAPEIFTDMDSKIAKYERMIFAAGGAGAAVVPVMVILMYTELDPFIALLWAALLLFALYYVIVLVGLSRRVRQLRRR
jgi:hypothetical protein